MLKNRRFFIKTLMKLGLLSIIPNKIIAFNDIQNCEVTSTDIEGPFYIPNSPNVYNLTPPSANIESFLFLTGTVYANDCITPIPNATVDIWHANQGEYNTKLNTYINSDYENTYYRSNINTDGNGNYAFKTIVPGKYLNGSYYRPSHIHCKSSYLGTNELTTQIYFEGDSSIELDPWASSQDAANRIITLDLDTNNNFNGVFDIVLNISPSEINNSHLIEQQIIKSIWPNPINKETYIHLNPALTNLSLEILDINGKKIIKKAIYRNTRVHLHTILNTKIKKGVYILKITSENGNIEAKRFIIL